MSRDLMYDDKTGDLVIQNGRPQFVQGEDEMSQAFASRLMIKQGSFELNPDIGLSWSGLLSDGFSKEIAEENITECLEQDARVDSVNNVSIEVDENHHAIAHTQIVIAGQLQTYENDLGEVD